MLIILKYLGCYMYLRQLTTYMRTREQKIAGAQLRNIDLSYPGVASDVSGKQYISCMALIVCYQVNKESKSWRQFIERMPRIIKMMPLNRLIKGLKCKTYC